MAEQGFCKPQVGGSMPSGSSIIMKSLIFAIAMMLIASLATAETSRFVWKGHEHQAEVLSNVSIGVEAGMSIIHALKSNDKPKAFERLACQAAVSIAATEVLKHTFNRTRPDGSDNLSWPSGHTSLSFSFGWSWGSSLAFGASVGDMRMGARRHWPTDVLGGLGVGAASKLACSGI